MSATKKHLRLVDQQPPPRYRYECDSARGVDPVTGAVNPCPFHQCRHNLHDEQIAALARGMRPDQSVTCALDAEIDGGLTLDRVGQILGVSRERVRQIENLAFRSMRRRAKFAGTIAEALKKHAENND